ASEKIAQQPRPRFLRFPLSAFNRQHYFAPVPQGAHDHQQRGLAILKTRFHIQTIGPGVHYLEIIQPPAAPRRVLQLPLRPQPLDRRRRERRTIAEQSTQRELEISLGEPVEVKLGQKLADFFGPAHEQRQKPTLEALLQAPYPRPLHFDRARHHR